MADVNVKVICRFRPINEREKREGEARVAFCGLMQLLAFRSLNQTHRFRLSLALGLILHAHVCSRDALRNRARSRARVLLQATSFIRTLN